MRVDADDEPDILIRPARIVANVRRQQGQDGPDPRKSQKSGADKGPELCAEATR